MSELLKLSKQQQYDAVWQRLAALCQGETDRIALMATIVCELYQAFAQFHWVGFYRNVGDQLLKVGPYQGTHGCLTIPFSQGVCGKCARERKLQNVPDVTGLPYHIACSATTRSELVVPISAGDQLLAVLDVDSNDPAAFDQLDEAYLQRVEEFFRGTAD